MSRSDMVNYTRVMRVVCADEATDKGVAVTDGIKRMMTASAKIADTDESTMAETERKYVRTMRAICASYLAERFGELATEAWSGALIKPDDQLELGDASRSG